ncbi:hypothetical protein FPV67DRAFT_1446303 [Lyophyllum atratum]|nr:hypothetical protein FPV67DRAFT_1446303 [Lyophyllum atratum]
MDFGADSAFGDLASALPPPRHSRLPNANISITLPYVGRVEATLPLDPSQHMLAQLPSLRASVTLHVGRGSNYELAVAGGRIFTKDRLVWAALMDDAPQEQWRITPQLHMGPNAYTLFGSIEKTSEYEGWVLDKQEPFNQVTCRPLIIGPSDPPFFPQTSSG